MIIDLIKAMQPMASVTIYKGVIYVNGTPIDRRY
jgi:hypothetical protein